MGRKGSSRAAKLPRRDTKHGGQPGDAVATVHLTPDRQSMFTHASAKAFVPVSGGWGCLGRTNVVHKLRAHFLRGGLRFGT
jgi:hypothetical protein